MSCTSLKMVDGSESLGDTRLRLCYLANGKSIHTVKWIKYFAEEGHDVHLMVFDDTDQIEGVKVHNIKYRSKLAYPFRILDVKEVIKEIDPDILHAHYISNYGVYAAFSGFRPLVVTAWGSDILVDAKNSIIKRYFVNYTLKKADMITCDAEHMKEAIKSYGIPTEKVNIIFFGIDTRKFKPEEKNKELRAKLEIGGSPAIISLRNLEPLYNVESLIEAIPLVLKEIPDAKFIIAGKGSEGERLKNLAVSLDVLDSVRFIGFVLNDELPKYLNAMDVCVSTSLSDAGIAASTAEAMACGLPVIVTDVADNRWWVKDGENGFVVPIKDPKLLAERIIYLLKNVDIRRHFGDANRKIIEEKNDYYREMAKMEDIYQKLVMRREE
jgi:glycosyltransferase involved in cell wall biosynthesis